MAALVAFSPNTTVGQALTTSQRLNVTVGGNGRRMRIANSGPGAVYVQFYEASASPPTMTAINSMIILAGAIELFTVASDTTVVALLADGNAGGATANLTRGEGE